MTKRKTGMSEEGLQAFGKRIREVRKHFNLSQPVFAAKLGIHSSYLSELERGKNKTSIDFLYKIKEFFGVSLDYMVCGEGELFPPKEEPVKPETGDRDYVEHILSRDDVIWFMEKSTLFETAMLTYACRFHLENKNNIDQNLEYIKKRKEASKDD